MQMYAICKFGSTQFQNLPALQARGSTFSGTSRMVWTPGPGWVTPVSVGYIGLASAIWWGKFTSNVKSQLTTLFAHIFILLQTCGTTIEWSDPKGTVHKSNLKSQKFYGHPWAPPKESTASAGSDIPTESHGSPLNLREVLTADFLPLCVNLTCLQTFLRYSSGCDTTPWSQQNLAANKHETSLEITH